MNERKLETMEKSELAREYFFKGYNCAQSVALAFTEELGMSEETVARTVSGFGGGYVLCAGGEVRGEVPLRIAGLMSTEPWETVRDATAAILKQASGMGIPYHVDPFITLSFLALPVIPELRLTDRGLFDVVRFAPVERE